LQAAAETHEEPALCAYVVVTTSIRQAIDYLLEVIKVTVT